MKEPDRQHALRVVSELERTLERIEVELQTDPDGEMLNDYMDDVDFYYAELNAMVARAYRETQGKRAEL